MLLGKWQSAVTNSNRAEPVAAVQRKHNERVKNELEENTNIIRKTLKTGNKF